MIDIYQTFYLQVWDDWAGKQNGALNISFPRNSSLQINWILFENHKLKTAPANHYNVMYNIFVPIKFLVYWQNFLVFSTEMESLSKPAILSRDSTQASLHASHINCYKDQTKKDCQLGTSVSCEYKWPFGGESLLFFFLGPWCQSQLRTVLCHLKAPRGV